MKEALLVVDPQKIYTDKSSDLFVNESNVIKKINKLIKSFKNQRKMVVFIKHEHKKSQTDCGRMFDFSGKKENVQFIENETFTQFDEELDIKKAI